MGVLLHETVRSIDNLKTTLKRYFLSIYAVYTRDS
jgi:hypothetical protein